MMDIKTERILCLYCKKPKKFFFNNQICSSCQSELEKDRLKMNKFNIKNKKLFLVTGNTGSGKTLLSIALTLKWSNWYIFYFDYQLFFNIDDIPDKNYNYDNEIIILKLANYNRNFIKKFTVLLNSVFVNVEKIFLISNCLTDFPIEIFNKAIAIYNAEKVLNNKLGSYFFEIIFNIINLKKNDYDNYKRLNDNSMIKASKLLYIDLVEKKNGYLLSNHQLRLYHR